MVAVLVTGAATPVPLTVSENVSAGSVIASVIVGTFTFTGVLLPAGNVNDVSTGV